jgi:4,5-DOPA dioxygenase extradiol
MEARQRMTTKTMPAMFLGHGNPMNALQTNDYTRAWAAIGANILRPKAILSISAHWYIPRTAVTAMQVPRTIHDFGGFPKELYEVEYPTQGDPALADRIRAMLSSYAVDLDNRWGLDHGTWSVLCHIYPKADIPVVQLSIDQTKPAAFHYEIGKKLAALRDIGILIIGSGNIVHNLWAYAWNRSAIKPHDWAIRFEKKVQELLLDEDDSSLINYENLGDDAMLSVPTPDHYLPLLYIIGCRKSGEKLSFPVTGIDGGSISMLAVQIG